MRACSSVSAALTLDVAITGFDAGVGATTGLGAGGAGGGSVHWCLLLLLVTAQEDASFVAYLCSDNASCFVGQVFPVCGGWAS